MTDPELVLEIQRELDQDLEDQRLYMELFGDDDELGMSDEFAEQLE